MTLPMSDGDNLGVVLDTQKINEAIESQQNGMSSLDRSQAEAMALI